MRTPSRVTLIPCLLAALAPALTAQRPDLDVTRFTTDTLILTPGARVVLDSTVRNIGLAGTGRSVNSAFYLSTDLTIDNGDIELHDWSTPSLGVGERDDHSRTVTIPLDIESRPYWIGILVDTRNVLDEVTRVNNRSAIPVVTRTTDLGVRRLLPTSLLTPGEPLHVALTVTNSGDLRADPSEVGIFLSTSSTLSTTTATFLGALPTPALQPGESAILTGQVPVPLCRRDYFDQLATFVDAFADVTNAVPESRENNNSNETGGVLLLPRRIDGSAFELEWMPRARANGTGAVTTSRAVVPLATGNRSQLCITAPAHVSSWYLLLWSGQPTFTFDAFTQLGIQLVNTSVFQNWVGTVSGDHDFAVFDLPAFPSVVGGFSAYTYLQIYNPSNFRLVAADLTPVRTVFQ